MNIQWGLHQSLERITLPMIWQGLDHHNTGIANAIPSKLVRILFLQKNLWTA